MLTEHALDVERILAQWPRSEEDAVAIQRKLAAKVIAEDAFPEPLQTVAGVDVAYAIDESRVFAAVVVLAIDSLETIAVGHASRKVEFPYVPGLFAFRELPAILAALATLESLPDAIVCDGQGIAHPRRCGLASHLGVLADMATIGVAKNRLTGVYDEPGESRGAFADLFDEGEIVGRALRTRDGVKPVFVSVGHRFSLDSACALTLKLATRYRLPETTRTADAYVNKLRADYVAGTN